jgi:two-component system alkaline phosphatase synthesis response regulator PhoP
VIYCVEDDGNIRDLIVYTLNATGFLAKGFSEPKSFYEALEEKLPELVILDIMLPEEDGLKILGKLKGHSKTKNIPVIIITAKTAEYDKVIGLDSGADDYITKPIAMMEFISRVKAVLRRVNKESSDKNILKMNDIVINLEKHEVTVNNEEVLLTYKEFELLRYLVENKGIVLTRDRLLETLWGYDFGGETRTVDVHIRTLRQKLGESGNAIKTVRGMGYKIEG